MKTAEPKDLARTALRCAWALSLVTAQTAVRLLGGAPRRALDPELEESRHRAEQALEEPLAGAVRTARYVQQGMADTLLEIVSGRLLRGDRDAGPGWRELARPWTTRAALPPKTGLR